MDENYLSDNAIKLYTSDQLLDITKRWWKINKNNTLYEYGGGGDCNNNNNNNNNHEDNLGFYVRTNYMYVYKKSKREQSEAAKLIYIAPLHMHSRESIFEVYKMLLRDVKMYYYGILNFLQVPTNDSTKMHRLARKIVVFLKITEKVPLKNKLCYEMLECNWQKWYSLICKYVVEKYTKYFPETRKLQQCDNNNDGGALEIPQGIFRWIQEVWLWRNILEYKNLLTINMRNGSIMKQIQGRDSIMRRQILSPKIKMFRSQIGLRFDLQANELLIPHSMLPEIKKSIAVDNVSFFNLHDPGRQDARFITLPEHVTIIMKRDPVLCKNSILFINRIAFVKSDLFYISSLATVGQNADFDGDAENAIINDDLKSSLEFSLTMSPELSIYLGYFDMRLDFTETHILYMHQRRLFPQDPYHDRYNWCVQISNIMWLTSQENLDAIMKFHKLQNDAIATTNSNRQQSSLYKKFNIFKYIEHTKGALKLLINSIYVDYGSKETFNLFNQINNDILNISNGQLRDTYNSHLPSQYLIGTSVFDETLMRITLSGAKGTCDHYISLIEALKPPSQQQQQREQQQDQASEYMCVDARENIETDNMEMYKKSLVALKSIGQAAKNVPINGHESFKTIIEFNGFAFSRKGISYNSNNLFNVDYRQLFFSHMNFSPELCLLHIVSESQ